MKTKQIIIAIVILILGVLIGKFAFSNSASKADTQSNETVVEHWTCSMHPQIDLPEPGDCPICGMDLILKSNSDGDELTINSFKMSKNAMALANIRTMVIGDSDTIPEASNSLELSGKIAVNDNASAMQTAHFGGRIERLYYKSEGEYVNRGALLASIYSPDLVTAQNELLEAMQVKELQPELYNAVRNKLKNWKISEKQILNIEQTKKVTTNFNVYANVSGYIETIFVEEGNHVKEGMPLFMVSNLSTVWAVFDVYEQDIKHFKKGLPITIRLNAYPDKEIKTKIDFIDPNLDLSTRIIAVRATLSNKEGKLKPGMFISSSIKLEGKSKTSSSVSVPKTAVMWTGKRSVVYVKTDKNQPIFELREVELGNNFGDNYQIISGLENGEEVVVNGTFTVDAAAQLQGKSSMMNTHIEKESTESEMEKEVVKLDVNSKFNEQLNQVFKDYIDIKNAFVATNATQAQENAKQALADLEKVQMKNLKKPEAHTVWMGELPKIKKSLQDIQQESDVEQQRSSFVKLSKSMVYLAKSFGVDNTIYVLHCPMADNNNGADWLSLESEVKNPFYGEKMLTCGEVTQTIQ